MKFNSLYHLRRKWQLLAASGTGWHSKVPSFQALIPLPLPPSDRVQSGCLPAVVTRLHPNPSSGGFLCSLEHSKVSFELLKGFPVTPGNSTLPLQGAGLHSEVVSPFQTAVGFSLEACVVTPLNP